MNHWRELGDFVRPRRSRQFVTDHNKGDKRNQKIIDGTASFAARTLQSGMHAGITSPARPWMRLTVPDPDLAEYKTVKEWLHTVTQRMLTVFQKTNTYNILPTLYGDLGVFATGAMAVMEDDLELLRCYSYPVGSYALGVSERQIVDTFVREYIMTVRQVVAQFGIENVSKAVKGLYDRGEYMEKLTICWVVSPNEEYEEGKLGAKYLPWSSCHFEKDETREDKFLRESGYNEFPIMAPRWDVTGEDIYGTECPGMIALGDIKELQLLRKKKAMAISWMVNPSLQVPASLRNGQRVSQIPGDQTVVDDTSQGKGIRATHEINFNVEHVRADIQDLRWMVKTAFYEPLFLMIAQSDDTTQRTATEILERHEEKLVALGPMLERCNDELLDPLVDRAFAMMERAGMIPPPPDELINMKLSVDYISLMAQAQKSIGVKALDQFVMSMIPMAEINPEVIDKVNWFEIVSGYGSSLGVPPKAIRTDEEAMQLIQARQKAQQAAQQAEMASKMGGAARDLSQAKLGQDSALDEMVSQGTA